MGQLGFQELVLIFIIALLVFGPKKLPELGKSLGKGLKEFKRATEDLKSNWDEQMREVDKIKEDTKKDLKEVERDMKAEFYASQGTPSSDPVPPKEEKEEEVSATNARQN